MARASSKEIPLDDHLASCRMNRVQTFKLTISESICSCWWAQGPIAAGPVSDDAYQQAQEKLLTDAGQRPQLCNLKKWMRALCSDWLLKRRQGSETPRYEISNMQNNDKIAF